MDDEERAIRNDANRGAQADFDRWLAGLTEEELDAFDADRAREMAALDAEAAEYRMGELRMAAEERAKMAAFDPRAVEGMF